MDTIKWVARYKISGRYAASAGNYRDLYKLLELLDIVDNVTTRTELWRI